MKYLKFSLFFLFSVAIISCGDDTCDVLSETVVGTWNVDLNDGGTMTFNEDGSFSDNNQILFDSSFDNADKTWNVSGNNLTLQAAQGGFTNEFTFGVTSFDCDNITANVDTTSGSTVSIVLTRN